MMVNAVPCLLFTQLHSMVIDLVYFMMDVVSDWMILKSKFAMFHFHFPIVGLVADIMNWTNLSLTKAPHAFSNIL